MILTVTLNPAIDKLLVLNEFKLHKLHRLEEDERSMITPGGKGVNIALNLKLMGENVIASGFAGGHSGHMLCDKIRLEGITTNFIFAEGATRTNTAILDQKNETLTEINDYGQIILPDDLEFFMENFHRLMFRSRMVVIAGSLPLGMPRDTYREMINIVHRQHKKVIFHAAPKYTDLIMGVSPFLINPDMRSSHELLGKPLDGIEEFIHVGKEILNQNPKTEIVLFTHRIENVVAVTQKESYILRPKDLKIVNMLGYADAYLAGFIHEYDKTENIITALHYGSAAALQNVEMIHKIAFDKAQVQKNLERIEIETRS